MVISKKDIECNEIIKKIERLTSSIRQFVRLVNSSVPKDVKLNNENFIIEREEENSFLDDGNTSCAGYGYKVYWCYTPKSVQVKDEAVIDLMQPEALTFIFECGERLIDHKKNGFDFFLLYYKTDNVEKQAERIDYINDNYKENHLFRPYVLMQVVWRVKNAYGLYPKNISDDEDDFEKFKKHFTQEVKEFKVDRKDCVFKNNVSTAVLEEIKQFNRLASQFITVVNCYCAVSSKKANLEDVKKFLYEGECSVALEKAMQSFCMNEIFNPKGKEVYPKSFLWQRDKHYTHHINENNNSFYFYDCIKSILGYSYFNDHVYMQGIAENWHSRLLYFSYYYDRRENKKVYTITMTSCEGYFRKNYMHVIEAATVKDLLSSANAIKVAKWLEEILEKTYLLNYYSLLIREKKVRNFETSCEIN